MKNKSAKEKMIYFYHAEMCKVFSHPTRLEIINTLRDKEVTVGDLAKKLKLGIGNLSQHLSMMKDRRILSSRKEGNQVYYRIANPKMLEAFDLLREILLEQIQKDSLLLTEEIKLKRRKNE